MLICAMEWLRGWLTPMPRQGNLGRRGEDLAARYYRRRGYVIVEERCRDRLAEADLIAYRRGVLVFCEVKTRRSSRHGRPEDAVDRRKQIRLSRFAERFCHRYRLDEVRVRFDVFAVVWPVDRRPPQCKHYRQAFAMQLRLPGVP